MMDRLGPLFCDIPSYIMIALKSVQLLRQEAERCIERIVAEVWREE